ncbi:longevity-assurance protein [Xylaria sp. CBS 124048]|nr:longevity-assurance protein [Xylaria sp. CBS 124048]
MAAKSKASRNRPPQSSMGWLSKHQIGVSFHILLSIFAVHTLLPRARPYTSKFFSLSGYNPATGKYAIGHDDVYFIGFCIVLFSGIRASSMRYLLVPLAKCCGLTNKQRLTRFSEQGWMIMYTAVFWSLGMRIYITSPYFLNLEALWADWPQRELEGLTKGYVLAQLAYWMQQVLVVNLEARRPDYWLMIAHHVATTTLITAAYAYHHTRVTNLIMVLMDIIELIFPLAKCLKYLGYTTICDVLFGVFMVTWLVTRHVFYLMICWSVYTDLPRMMPTSCYQGAGDNVQGPFPVPDGWSYLLEPFRSPDGLVCVTDAINTGFLTYLLVLQAIMIPWSLSIVRVAIRVLSGKSAEDVRSDDEAEEEEKEKAAGESNNESKQLVEKEVEADAIDFEVWKRRNSVKDTARSSGASLSRHSDRKELLNRIGCERQIE